MSAVAQACQLLAPLLGVDDPMDGSDIASYVLEVGDEKATLEYLKEMFGDDPRLADVAGGIANINQRQSGKTSQDTPQKLSFATAAATSQAAPPGLAPPPGLGVASPDTSANKPEASAATAAKSNFQDEDTAEAETETDTDGREPPQKRRPRKFVSLLSREGQAGLSTMLPGRHICECMTTRHMLINNCLGCGRIVCSQEGVGPCVFCGALVVTPEQQDTLQRRSKKSQKLLDKIIRDTIPSGSPLAAVPAEQMLRSALPSASGTDALQKAQLHKDRLVHFDRSTAKRTGVIDDQADYFASDSNSWLSAQERDKVKAKEAALLAARSKARKDRKITLDFAGRQVLEQDNMAEAPSLYDPRFHGSDGVTPTAESIEDMQQRIHAERVRAGFRDTPAMMSEAPINRAEFRAQGRLQAHGEQKGKGSAADGGGKTAGSRLQDHELSEMSDQGVCMSMHQPWASLLVEGIKMHEGRVWYTSHRGRLWIAAATAEPDEEETERQHAFYKAKYGEDVPLPTQYPTACLLGCVDVDDCLPQDEYREKFPDGESSMPYVFICSNPQEMVVRFPMKGQHKIYKLDKELHQAARQGLRPVDIDLTGR
eukprot:m.55900 g.55900  ORF g.55900 m.55900 type:complete len:597 (-) comp12563_c0_seq3:84-1874(-)